MTEFGTDFDGVTDITPELAALTTEQEQGKAYLQAVARRIIDGPGSLYSRTWGLGIARFIGGSTPLPVIASMVQAEAEKDERTLSARFDGAIDGDRLTGRLRLETYTGPFELTFAVSAVSASVISDVFGEL